MSKEAGFLQLRRGVWPHVRDGRMSHDDTLVFAYIASQADSRTGVWMGSAGALAGELAYSPRNARRILERLDLDECGGYIKRFPIPGSHVCYPILVHKFLITDGEHKGEHLNARDSTSPSDLRYFPGEQESEHKGEHKASQRELDNIEQREKKPQAAKKLPSPSDPRFTPFLHFAYKSYEQKHGLKPSWLKKDFEQLRLLLKSNVSLNAEELERRWKNYLDSTESFIAKQGHALGYFALHADAFVDGPILKPIGGKNGHKQSGSELLAHNLRVAGFEAPKPAS